MRKLILRFMVFMAALWGLGQVSLPVLLVAIGLLLVIVAAVHIWATPQNDNP